MDSISRIEYTKWMVWREYQYTGHIHVLHQDVDASEIPSIGET